MGMRVGHEAFQTGPGAYRHCDNLVTWIVDSIIRTNSVIFFVRESAFNRTVLAFVDVQTYRTLVKHFCKQPRLRRFSSNSHPWNPSGKNERNSTIIDRILRRYLDVKVDYCLNIVHPKSIGRDHQFHIPSDPKTPQLHSDSRPPEKTRLLQILRTSKKCSLDIVTNEWHAPQGPRNL